MLQDALDDWNPWWSETSSSHVPADLHGIMRELVSEIHPFIANYKIKILVGIRRSGKSTLLYQLIERLLTSMSVSPQEIVLLNFEDMRLSTNTLEKCFEEYLEYVRPQASPHVFLDEIHNSRDWVPFVRRLSEQRKAHFYITDSSSFFIPRELQPVLTGRKVTFEVFPLSFREFLGFKKVNVEDVRGTEEKARIRGYLREYMERGGFPEPFFYSISLARKILAEYFDDIVTRDLVARYRMPAETTRQLVMYLMSNPSQRFSYRKLSTIFKTGVDTIQHYLEKLESIYLFFKVPKYAVKVKEQFLAPKKFYPIDTGMVNVAGFRFSENLGHLLELIVFLHLKRKYTQIFYYQGSSHKPHEVDFVVTKGKMVTHLINVSFDLEDSHTRKREINGLKHAMKSLRVKKGLIITWNEEETIRLNAEKQIYVIPAWKWLLQQKEEREIEI